MTFINMGEVAVAAPLKKAHYQFHRAQQLKAAVSSCVTDYYSKASSGAAFEARGVLVTGKSRVGKTRELQRLIRDINDSGETMPNGQPIRFVSCILSGHITWKSLGIATLEALGYPCNGQRTQTYIWDMVRQQAKRQGIIGIHYDECQHMFADTGHTTNRVVLDSFKALLKDPRWPLILILSGVPDLAKHIENDTSSEERRQLRHLLRPVHFDMINPERDLGELNALAYTYADKAGVNFDGLSNADFLERLAFVSCNRWGLAIEMVIEAFTCCALAGAQDVSIEHFDEAFSRTHGTQKGFSPFMMDDYIDVFDQDRLLEYLSSDG